MSRVVDAEADDEDDAHAGHGVDGEAPVEDVASHVDLKRAEFSVSMGDSIRSPSKSMVLGCVNLTEADMTCYHATYRT